MKLTKIITESRSVLKDDIKNSFVMGARKMFGLIPVLEWKLAIESLYLELNFTSLINDVSI